MKRKKRMAAFIKVDDLVVTFWRNLCFYYKLLYYYYYDLLIKHICNTPINLFRSFIHSLSMSSALSPLHFIYYQTLNQLKY